MASATTRSPAAAATTRSPALSGDDTISGDAGDDSLLGGAGHNIIDGGSGSDRFGRSAFSCGIFDCTLGVDDFRANDGVQESIDCFGIAGSSATVDALDTVANCTTVIRSGPPPRCAPLATCPAPRASVRVPSRITRRGLLRRGILVRVTCPGPCKARLRLSIKGRTIATRRASFKAAGSKTVRLRISRRAGRRVRTASQLTLRLATTFAEAAGTTRKSNRIIMRRT